MFCIQCKQCLPIQKVLLVLTNTGRNVSSGVSTMCGKVETLVLVLVLCGKVFTSYVKCENIFRGRMHKNSVNGCSQSGEETKWWMILHFFPPMNVKINLPQLVSYRYRLRGDTIILSSTTTQEL